MNQDPDDIRNGELDQSRLTAYALEQLEGAERAAVEALLAGSDRSRHTVEEIRALAAEVKRAADGEALPSRSSELRVILEQYLGNEEVAEMNAKPEPSSAKKPRHGRRRSTLIWAAAVCALVAAVPAYVLISGSLGPDLRPVALDYRGAAETSAATHAGAESAKGFGYRESEAEPLMVSAEGDDAARGQVSDAPAEGRSRGITVGKRLRPTDDGPVVASGEMVRGAPLKRAEGKPAKPASAPKLAEAEIVAGAEESHRVAGKEDATPAMQAPGDSSTDFGTYAPYSRENHGAKAAQPGGMDRLSTGADSRGVESKPGKTPATGESLLATKAPQGQPAGETPAPTAGGGGVMMGGMGMGGMSGMGGMPAGPGMEMDDAGMGMMGMPGSSAQYGAAGQPADEKLGQSMYYAVGKGQAPAPTDEAGMSLGIEAGRPVQTQPAAPSAAPSRPSPASVALQPSADQKSPVEVHLIERLDVKIVADKAKESELLGQRLVETEGRFVRGRPLHRLPSPGTEQYDPIVENPFLSAADNPESTFSVDVDTASYANVRRFLDSGQLPPPNAVRIEELVNYFRYDYPQPDGEVPFSVNMETAQCPWDTEHRLVRIGLKGREIDPEQRGPSNLVFLLDVSGSMRDENKLPLVQYAMNRLVDQLTEDDRVAIVTYAGEAGVALESTSGEKRKTIRRAIDNLSAGGSTHGSAGIEMAYEQAMQHFVEDGTNRVILCTDGDLNVGITDDDELVKLIGQQATSGVFLTVLGFGTGNLKDSKMEKLADKGNGIYAYVDGRREARRVLVEQMAGSLVTIAKDVKIQIEFNPAEVASYRLIGYENRIMAAADFANDKKDAGEIGAGHSVTALYEIVPGGADSGGALGRELKYQRKTGRELTEAASTGELFTLKLRYKEPEGEKSKLLEFVQKDSDKRFGQASADFRFASSVAAFGMLLRGSQYAGDLTWSAAEELAAGGLGEDPGGYRNEFLELIHRAGELRSR